MDAIESSAPLLHRNQDHPTTMEAESAPAGLSDPPSSDTSDNGVESNDMAVETEEPEMHQDETGTETTRHDSAEEADSGSNDHMNESRLLEMIENGELEYSLEEDPEYEDDETDTNPIEILFEPSMPLPIPNEDSSSSTDSTKKRGAPDSPHEEDDGHVPKKPKLVENEPEAPSEPIPQVEIPATTTPIAMDVDQPKLEAAPPVVEEKKDEIKMPAPATPKQKTPSRGRGTPYVATTPLAVVTRTRALSASTAGAETIVPEQSLSVPKFMPKAPIRAIEIPTWSIRESYALEEDIRSDYQAFRSSNKAGSSSASSSANSSIYELEKKFYRACDVTIAQELIAASRTGRCEAHQNSSAVPSCTKCRVDLKEETDEDASYAVRHYRREIAERLGWDVGPGPKRFRKEDRDMTVDEFKASNLWPTYFTTHKGKLLPKDLWAQNMVPERKPRQSPSEHHAGPGRPRSRTSNKNASAPKVAPPVVVPKGFVLKIRSAAGVTVVKGGNATPSPAALVRRPAPVPGTATSPKKVIVKKSAGIAPLPPNGIAPIGEKSVAPSPAQSVVLPAQVPTAPPASASQVPLAPHAATAPVILSKGPAKLIVRMGNRTFAPTAQTTTPAAAAPPIAKENNADNLANPDAPLPTQQTAAHVASTPQVVVPTTDSAVK